MKKVQAALAYTVAALMVPLILAGFMLTGGKEMIERVVAATDLTPLPPRSMAARWRARSTTARTRPRSTA